MLLVLLYFLLNFAGFFLFLFIWNLLPKPKPFDYTTIPGMKLNVSSADEIPEMVVRPGEKVRKEFKGNFEDIEKHSHFRELLDYLNLKYGPLSSFWWSNRYVVVISDEKFIVELKKYRASLLAVSPFSIGSYLHAHPKFCTSIENGTLKIKPGFPAPEFDRELDEDVQNKLVMSLEDVTSSEGPCDISQAIQNLKQGKVQLQKTRKSLSRPLMVVFDEEIWIDAHPIPKYIPIIIHTSEMTRGWSDDELFPKFYAQLYWLPGFANAIQ